MGETAVRTPEVEVVLLHSNDIHSRLELAAKMSTYISETRRTYGKGRVLALDIGDHMDRMRIETEASDGLVNIELLNEAAYDAATLGNNEGLTFTQDQLDDAFREHAHFQTLCANMRRLSSGERPSWLQPSTIIRKGRLTFGIIGVTAAFADFYELLDWEAGDPLAAVAEQAAALREQVDVLVVMSHLGLSHDRQMAQTVPGIDLILGGHTHHLLEQPEIIGQTHICAAGKFGEYMGRIEIGLSAPDGRPTFRVTCVPMAAYEEKPEAAAIIGGFKTAGQRRLSRVVSRLAAPLPTRVDRESPLGNLLAAGLKRWTGSEIGLVNTGQLLGGLAEGEVTAGDLHALCPSPINPCRMTLTGLDLLRALEEALLAEFIDKPIRGFGFRGSVLGTLAVDGLEITWDPEAPSYSKIISLTVNGQDFDPDREYAVGTIDMFTFGVGYETIKNGKDIKYFLPEFIRDVLALELQDQQALLDSTRCRWNMAGKEHGTAG